MAKTHITAYDMKEMFKDIYNALEYDIILKNENTGEQKKVYINEYLLTDFYTYSLDLRDNKDIEDYTFNGNGFNFPNFDEWVNSRGTSSASYGQVELEGIEVVASEDIDMGSATSRITFIMPMEKADVFESHISKIRLLVAGHRYSFINAENETISFYATIGELQYEQEPFDTPIGKCVIINVTFGIAYMQDAFSSNLSDIEISLNGTDYEHLYYNQLTDSIIFNGKSNLIQNKPYAGASIQSSVSYSITITYWIYILDNVQLELNRKLKSIVNDTEAYSDTINIPMWIREKVPYFDDGTYKEQTITTKMVVANYTTNIKNSDFINVSLVLNRYRK